MKGIVLRIDLPGGSAIASDQILHALKRPRQLASRLLSAWVQLLHPEGISSRWLPIALSRSRVPLPVPLASWGNFALGKSAELIGVNARELAVGNDANFDLAVTPWNAEQLQTVNQQADAVYADFTQKVAEGRKMPLDKVQQVARGRVWTGADAKRYGLVDELGGFWTAVDEEKRLTGIAPQNPIRLKTFPEQRGFFASLVRLADGSTAAAQVIDTLAALSQSASVRVLLDSIESASGAVQLRAVGLPN